MTPASHRELSKACIDIGYFTASAQPVLAFWRGRMGLAHEAAVPFNDGLVQHRHALGDSVLKVNTSATPLAPSPCGYRELLVARAGVREPTTVRDPDGNPVTLVPPGHHGIDGVGLRVAVADPDAQAHFYRTAMGFEQTGPATFRCGTSVLLVEPDPQAAQAGHWIAPGLRYFTLHVRRVDAAFAAITDAGATIGERPYSIGRIARISFVRDPAGNWIEVAQRAALAGPWWHEP